MSNKVIVCDCRAINKSGFLTALIVCFALLIFSGNCSALPKIEPAQNLLSRMVEASQSRDYQGTFTYEQAGALKTFKVMHAVRDGLAHERLVYLDGPKAIVSHSSNPLSCRRTSDLLLRGDFLADGIVAGRIEDFYNLQLRGEDRVAGRVVSELLILPKDQLRYGYVLSIDKVSGLLLRSILISPDRKQVLERFQFVELDLDSSIDEREWQANVDKQIPSGDLEPCQVADKAQAESIAWRVNWLPSGFVLAGRDQVVSDDSESLVYTDGLAFFSVFIDRKKSIRMPPVQANRGATVAVFAHSTLDNQNYEMCVVGEIPMLSAKKIVNSIRPSTTR